MKALSSMLNFPTFSRNILGFAFFAFLVYLTFGNLPSSTQSRIWTPSPHPDDGATHINDERPPPSQPYCEASGNSSRNILVSLKTGATETEKLFIGLKTFLHCVSRYVLFSDLEEDVHGAHLQDALQGFDSSLKETHEDFKFYRQLHEYQQLGKSYKLLMKEASNVKEENPAWKLDKWKFLPILQRAVDEDSHADWYVFIEADTYLLWSNLIRLLDRFDPSKGYYFGASNFYSGFEYGHGGSGYVISRPAARGVAGMVKTSPERYADLTEQSCCGDLLLGQALREFDVNLTSMWPTIQGETPTSLDYSSRNWCYPVVTYHHMSSAETSTMFEFEQSWISRSAEPILHRDVYFGLIESRLAPSIESWDNMSQKSASAVSVDGQSPNDSFEACHKLCISDHSCKQFSWRSQNCRTSDVFRMGFKSSDQSLTSGFMMDRINTFIQDLGDCTTPTWIESSNH